MVLSVTITKKISITFIMLGLTACVSVNPYTQPNGAGTQSAAQVIDKSGQLTENEVLLEPQPTAVPKEVSAVAAAPAVVNNLLIKAKKQQQQDDLNAAMSTVERAIRIAPRYPASYYQLAELKFESNDFSNAKSLAQKSISLGASGSLKRRALELVQMSDNYISQGL
mgnify:FL=1